MELRARLFPLGEEAGRALASLLPTGGLDVRSARYPVDLDDPRLPRILAAGEFWVAGETVFSAAELRSVTHFELVCRSVVREAAGDFERNDAVRGQTPLVNAGAEHPIRVMRGLFLGRISLKPNAVGGVGEWTGEYVAGSAVVQTMKQAGFTGVSFLPVSNPKTGRAHESHFQVFSDALMPPAVIDCSVERIRSRHPSEDGWLRHLGCLAYEPGALPGRADFNRTAEPWAGWHGWPSWVVSARVERAFKHAKLRGWAFRPVLSTGSGLYERYVSRWSKLRDAVSASGSSKMDGGRW